MDRKTDALAELISAAKIRARQPTMIREARDSGATWAEIADAAQMSRTQVIEQSKKK